jgi:hypothetical protein
MPATIQIHEMSALTTGVNKTGGTVRFKAADDSTVDTNNPIQVPPSGTNYSYTKKLRAYMEAPPSVNVSNLRWYTDGSSGFGTGIGVNYKNLGNTWSANYNTAMTGGTDLFTKTSASPIVGDATNTGPFLPAADNSYIGDLLELQMWVASTATNGQLSGETFTLAYDEV